MGRSRFGRAAAITAVAVTITAMAVAMVALTAAPADAGHRSRIVVYPYAPPPAFGGPFPLRDVPVPYYPAAAYQVIQWRSGYCQILDYRLQTRPLPVEYWAVTPPLLTLDAAFAAKERMVRARLCF